MVYISVFFLYTPAVYLQKCFCRKTLKMVYKLLKTNRKKMSLYIFQVNWAYIYHLGRKKVMVYVPGYLDKYTSFSVGLRKHTRRYICSVSREYILASQLFQDG